MVGFRTMGGARGKLMDSLVNQTNTQGGVKKAGLPSTVGIVASVSGIYRYRIGCPCPADKFIISTTTTCGGGIGRRPVQPRC